MNSFHRFCILWVLTLVGYFWVKLDWTSLEHLNGPLVPFPLVYAGKRQVAYISWLVFLLDYLSDPHGAVITHTHTVLQSG